MVIKFTDLKAPKERYVREMVSSPKGNIRIYEPALADIETIIEIQNNKGQFDEATGMMAFDENVVIREIFPVLTDLDMSDISDEEMQDVIDNPSIYLLAIQNIVSQIVTEINNMVLQRIKSELIQAMGVADQALVVANIPNMMSREAKAKGDDATAEKFAKIGTTVLDKMVDNLAGGMVDADKVNDGGEVEKKVE